MTDGLSETVSEKPKRGRPRTVPNIALVESLFPEIQTARGQANTAYSLRAIRVIDDVRDRRLRKALEWLCPKRDAVWQGTATYRSTILAELGRFEGDEELLAFAAAVCHADPRLTAWEAVRRLRRARLGRAPKPDADDLSSRLCKLIDEYRNAHPGTTLRTIRDAFGMTFDAARLVLPESDLDSEAPALEGGGR